MKENINCNASTFNKSDLKISIKHTGPQIPFLFNHVFCEYCKTNILPKVLNKYTEDLTEPANLVNLIDNWNVSYILSRGQLIMLTHTSFHCCVGKGHQRKKEKVLLKSIFSSKTIAVDTSKQAFSNQATITGKYAGN